MSVGDVAEFMEQKLYIGFKGKNNASSTLVERLSDSHCLLTNSFAGVKRDIEGLPDHYDSVLMFGIDKNLKNAVRIEHVAEREGARLCSGLDLKEISALLSTAGVRNLISDTPTGYLCNDAYWFALQKFKGKAVFIHIPTMKNMNNSFFERMKEALAVEFLLCDVN